MTTATGSRPLTSHRNEERGVTWTATPPRVQWLERVAETFDKFEEDVLRVQPATIRGRRRAVVRFGTPIDVSTLRSEGVGAEQLTQQLETAVQSLLDAGDVESATTTYD